MMRYTNCFLYALILLPVNIYSTWEIIKPGIKYKNLIFNNPAQSIHILVVDPQQNSIKIGIAHDICASAEKTTELAKRNNAVAAINAGFFDFGCRNRIYDLMLKGLDCLGYSNYNAYPLYSLRINNKYFSLSHMFTGAIAWNNDDQKPLFSGIITKVNVKINNQSYSVTELNKPYPDGPALYSSDYGNKTPFHKQKRIEIVMVNNRIEKIYVNSPGNTDIPKNGWVYALPKKYKNYLDLFHEDDEISIDTAHTHREDFISAHNDDWLFKDNILASIPLLVYDNHTVPTLDTLTSEFYTHKHPRSAVGLLKNGNWVFVVVDGRQKHSTGFTIMELAHFMEKIGCQGALNLDGGGSSTMVIDGKIVNLPSGRQYSFVRKERPISNAFLICSK